MTSGTQSIPELLARIAELEQRVTELTGVDRPKAKLSDRDMAESEARLAMLSENLPAIVWSTDLDLVFTSSAGQGLAALGLEKSAVVGLSLNRFFQTEDPDFEAIAAHRKALRGAAVDYDQVWDGRHYRTHVEPLRDATGAITGTIGVAIDITEALRTEEALQQAERLDTLGVLTGGVAHEFNNLLLAILGNADLLAGELQSHPAALELVGEISAAASRGAKLTDSMLSYSGRAGFHPEPVDLNDIVGSMQDLLGAVLPKKVPLQCDLDPDLPAVFGDEAQLKQILMNLVTNAAEASTDNAVPVRVRTHTLFADEGFLEQAVLGKSLAPGEYVAVEVEDRGWGMDKDARSRVFDPFFTTKFAGRGLGLAAVLGVVRRHRGAINLESQPGEGTSVTVLLPMAERHTAGKSTDGAGTERPLILVVDDEEQVRTILERTLERSGFETLMASDGREAVAAFRERAGDIAAVLLDMTMPVLGGEEVFREIRELDDTVPVLLMSGYTESDTLGRFTEGGPAGFIHKPFSPGSLATKIRSLLK